MCNAIGIVNYEGPNVQVKGMQDYRPVSAFSFLGRYRLVDFPISNLSNSGVNHIKVFVKTNPRSLLEHLGTGRHYNINSKRGKLHILPAKSMDENDFYSNDINSYMYNMQAIEDANYPYVVLTPSHFVFRQDFSALLDTHIESGADITMLYQNVDNAKESFVNCDVVNFFFVFIFSSLLSFPPTGIQYGAELRAVSVFARFLINELHFPFFADRKDFIQNGVGCILLAHQLK